jgi:hypothetical protein
MVRGTIGIVKIHGIINKLQPSSIIIHQQMHQYYLLFKIGFNP